MARAALVVILLVTGCTGAAAPVGVMRTPPSASASAIAPPATEPSPNPSPFVDLPPSRVDFSCRLPVTRSTSGGDFVSYQGGFVTFPQGVWQPDPAGVISSGYVTADFFSTTSPSLRGIPETGPPFYDLAMKRWVPVGAGQASPDGARYAYGSLTASNRDSSLRIHVVDVRTASDREFTVPAITGFGAQIGALVEDFDGASVYFSSQQAQGPPLGVWRLDVASGAVTELTSSAGIAAVRGGYAWVNRIDLRDPQGPQFPGIGGQHSNSVVRVDLATGEEMVWYYAKGNEVYFAGFDKSGDPIIANSWPPFANGFLLIAFSPRGDVATVYDGSRQLWFGTAQPDTSGRLWLGNDRGIYLYSPGSGLRKVFAIANGPTTLEETIQPAGFCT